MSKCFSSLKHFWAKQRPLYGFSLSADDADVPRDQQPGRMNEMNAAQLRKLQLNDEDRALMNKFKAQGECLQCLPRTGRTRVRIPASLCLTIKCNTNVVYFILFF